MERLLLVDLCEADGLTALHLATIGGWERETGQTRRDDIGKKRHIELHLFPLRISLQGHHAVCSTLIEGRADVDARSAQHDTPLMWAAHLGRRLGVCNWAVQPRRNGL